HCQGDLRQNPSEGRLAGSVGLRDKPRQNPTRPKAKISKTTATPIQCNRLTRLLQARAGRGRALPIAECGAADSPKKRHAVRRDDLSGEQINAPRPDKTQGACRFAP